MYIGGILGAVSGIIGSIGTIVGAFKNIAGLSPMASGVACAAIFLLGVWMLVEMEDAPFAPPEAGCAEA